MDRERLDRQIRFILELDKEKSILRQTHLSGGGPRENDAEHAWHMAIMAYLLREYANEEVDIGRVMLMCLIHDVVEIDAGDSYAYDPEAQKSAPERERKAAERLDGLLPEDQGSFLKALWEEFERGESPEAKFAHVMDNLQPMLLNHSNGGQDWSSRGVRRSQVEERNRHTAEGSETIWAYMKEIIEQNLQRGSLKDE